MFNLQRLKSVFYQNLHKVLPPASPTPTCYPVSPISFRYTTIASDQHSFTVSYLINNCGFSPQTALKASKLVHFDAPQKPDSVVAFFRNHGFSDSQIYSIFRREPKLLLCNPRKRVLPKFEFLLSKGASSADAVRMVSNSPSFLNRSLENHIIPTFELLKGILQSDDKVIYGLKRHLGFFSSHIVQHNVKLLLDFGVTNSNIWILLSRWPSILSTSNLMKSLEELKELEFDPLKSNFVVALLAKKSLTKYQWDAKVDAFKSWGWSEESILEAFRREPHCMLASKNKINAVMSFWVNQLGWSSLALVKRPRIFGFNLDKRTIPRALVLQYLLSKGLRNKSASLLTPFFMSEKLFLEKFVNCFEAEETSQLLRLYQESLNR